MPNYRVVLQSPARHDLYEAYEYARKFAPSAADAWLERFYKLTKTLETHPQRCPRAHETFTTIVADVRELLFGKRPNVFRVLYSIDGDKVRILRVLRAARQFLSEQEMKDLLDDTND